MGLYLNPGNEAFQISVNDDIYVDKSGLISYTNSRIGKRKRYLCVSRPRRFGKSMAAEMLAAYYSRGCHSETLFQGLKIYGEDTFADNLNQYDVFAINIQQFIRAAGSADRLVDYMEEQLLREIKKVYGAYVDLSAVHLPDALAAIFAEDKREKKGFIFIIDEWDCMFREVKEDKTTQKLYLDFLKDLLKDRAYVKLAYMTGILPIKKYGTHSALNIFDEFSMTDPKRLAQYVGFTETEVRKLCQTYEMDFEEAMRWYDGYRFRRNEHIYNPKSIVDAMLEEEYKSYWTSTETYEALRIYIDTNFDGLKDAIIAMLGGISCKIDIGTFQNDMTSFAGKDDVLTLLVHLGYLGYDEEDQSVFIPNDEVRDEFIRAVRNSGWEEVTRAVAASENLLKATWNREEQAVADGIRAVHEDNTSVLSYHDENSLSCVITLAYYSAKKDYVIFREFPTGKGFADIVFLPRRHSEKPALIVELKWDSSAEGAISQIRRRNYPQALEEYQGSLLLVGINYDRKEKSYQCVIEEAVGN